MTRIVILSYRLHQTKNMFRKILRSAYITLLALMLLTVLLVLSLRWLNPPASALMIEQKLTAIFSGESYSSQRPWTPWPSLPNNLKMAVIAAEDQQFPNHYGFDITAIRAALAHNSNS